MHVSMSSRAASLSASPCGADLALAIAPPDRPLAPSMFYPLERLS